MAHGSKKKHKKIPRQPDQATFVKNHKKLRKAYKDDLKDHGDHKVALEAYNLLECTLGKHDKDYSQTNDQIRGLNRQKTCAKGHCHNKCYQFTKGKNAKKRQDKYLKKHKSKFPNEYVSELEKADGSVPDSFLQFTSQKSSPSQQQQRMQDRSSQFVLNP